MTAAHTAQWCAITDVLATHNLTPKDPQAKSNAYVDELITAVASAGKTVLDSMMASFNETIDALYMQQANPALAAAIAIGESCGQDIIDARADDGSSAMGPPYLGDNSTDGMWRPTPPAFSPALMPTWANVTPWAMTVGSQFRAPPPPTLGSDEYAQAYLEVKSDGSMTGSGRSEEESTIAVFWSGNQMLSLHNMIRQITASMDLVEAGPFFKGGAVAFADAQIAAWDSKYHYSFWRPVSAIRLGNGDEYPLASDATWTPLRPTPIHPDYVAGHATTTASVVQALRFLLGGEDTVDVTLPSYAMQMGNSTVPGPRRYTSLTTIANEVASSRVWIGAHFRFACDAGVKMGQGIGIQSVRDLVGCGEGAYLWGEACLPCQENTYWADAHTMTDACLPCPPGQVSREGAGSCVPALRDLTIVGLAGMEAQAMSKATTARVRPLRRGKRGVFWIVQSNNGTASPDNVVVSLTLPAATEVKYLRSQAKPALEPWDGSKRYRKKPMVDGNGTTLVWQWAPLPANGERVFTVKISVKRTAPSPLTFVASTYYLDEDNTIYGRVDTPVVVPVQGK